jgi:hypothetical protein
MAGFHAQLGDTLESLGYLELFGKEPDESVTAPLAFEVAVAWEGIGYRTEALNWMEKVLRLGYSHTEIDTYPGLEDLRRDPRYQALLEETGVAK